jgi:molecular chaperone DnaK
MNEIIVGIDLGTTNSEIGIYNKGKVKLFEHGSSVIMPSYVGLDEKGALLIGEPAKNQYAAYPERTVKSVKRQMGEEINIPMGDKKFSPQEISALILKQLKTKAEESLGEPVKKAVITVPAYFSDPQRQATREAGEIAGLEVVKIINEPTAATLVYESGQQGSKKVMVYDLGGGTFDVSVVQIEDDIIEVIATHGNNHLGGDDFDALLVDYIINYIKTEYGIEDLTHQITARIERAAESAKCKLSTQPFVMIEEEYLLEKNGVPVHLKVEISRLDYEKMIIPLINETIEAIHTALKDSGLAAIDIDEILLVGGSTRTPLVHKSLEEIFSISPKSEVNPDLCVVHGASMQAALINGEKIKAILVDITPYTFGTSAIGEYHGEIFHNLFVPIIHKNTPIPVTRSEVFTTNYDNQEAVEVKVFQGEDKDARNNIEIGSFLIEGLSRAPAGNKIISSFSLDSNGILHVSAAEKKTGLEKSIIIDNAISRFEKNQLDSAREKVHDLFGDEVEISPDKIREKEKKKNSPSSIKNIMLVQAQALIEKAQRLLDGADADDREEIIDLIESIDSFKKDLDYNKLKEAMDELSEIIFYLES